MSAVIGSILLVIGAFIIYRYYSIHKKYIGASIVIFGALIGAIGAILLSIDSSQKQEEISGLNKKIAKLYEEISGSVTGGDSFCYLFPTPAFDEVNKLNFNLDQKGSYPVFDISIKIWDETCLEKITIPSLGDIEVLKNDKMTIDDWKKIQQSPEYAIRNAEIHKQIKSQMQKCLLLNEKVGIITPQNRTNIMDTPLLTYTFPSQCELSKNPQKYSADITARNGYYTQSILVEVLNKKYHIYSKVEKIISDSERIVVREYESLDADGFAIKNLK